MADHSAPKAGVARLFSVVRELARGPGEGSRVMQISRATGLTQATTHRLLHSLVAEGVVEQDPARRLYRLGAGFFALAAQAGHPGDLRVLCRPSLLHLCAGLGESVALFGHSGLEAVCLDRVEGPVPLRGAGADLGTRHPLGLGAGTLAILAFLPEAEREHILSARLPSLQDALSEDAPGLRAEVERVRRAGHAEHGRRGRAGPVVVAMPILDRCGRAVASLAVETAGDRLDDARLALMLGMLGRETAAVGPRVGLFDAALQPAPSSILSTPSVPPLVFPEPPVRPVPLRAADGPAPNPPSGGADPIVLPARPGA